MLGTPGVLHTDKNGTTRMIDLTTRLLQDRIVLCTGEVNPELSESVVAQLLYLESENAEKPINMLISGPGGSTSSGWEIISTMDTIKCPVYTTVIGETASMSAVIAISGEKDHRKIYPNARLMLHTVSSQAKGKIQDMEISMKEIKIANETIFNHLAERIGADVNKLKEFCDRDFWMSAEESVKFGIMSSIAEKHV